MITAMLRCQSSAGGHVISYLDTGPTEAARAGTVLFLHAFPLDADMWEPQLAAPAAGWRYVAPDLRGFGGSPGPGGDPGAPPSLDDYVDDVLALVDALRVETPVVAGLSMGGYAALALVRRAPERVRGLVLADTRADADNPAARAGRQRVIEALDHGGVRPVVEGLVPRLLGRSTLAARPEIAAQVLALGARQPIEGVRAAVRRMMGRPDATALLEGISSPVLVIVGEEDGITNPETARTMCGRMPDADMVVIPGAGHLSNLEQPDEFNDQLARFLGRRFGHA